MNYSNRTFRSSCAGCYMAFCDCDIDSYIKPGTVQPAAATDLKLAGYKPENYMHIYY